MAKPYKSRRTKLKRHDAGQDRHNKTVAHEMKQLRLENLYKAQRQRRKK